MKGTNTGQAGKGNWRTPQALFDTLDHRFGPFGVDAAADDKNAKVDYYWTKQHDGLRMPWLNRGTIFCNPPWHSAGRWVYKALDEWSHDDVKSVLILPASVNTEWFYELADHAYILILRGRVRFDLPDGQPNPRRPDRGAIAVSLGMYPPAIKTWDWEWYHEQQVKLMTREELREGIEKRSEPMEGMKAFILGDDDGTP